MGRGYIFSHFLVAAARGCILLLDALHARLFFQMFEQFKFCGGVARHRLILISKTFCNKVIFSAVLPRRDAQDPGVSAVSIKHILRIYYDLHLGRPNINYQIAVSQSLLIQPSFGKGKHNPHA